MTQVYDSEFTKNSTASSLSYISQYSGTWLNNISLQTVQVLEETEILPGQCSQEDFGHNKAFIGLVLEA